MANFFLPLAYIYIYIYGLIFYFFQENLAGSTT
jgi:hypothetical protein